MLAKGSMSLVWKEKNYKRVKYMHQLLTISMCILHIESFLDNNENSREKLDTMIQQNNYDLSSISS